MNTLTKKYNTEQQSKPARILITDSGTGGLSVCADIASRIKKHSAISAELIYFNAWPSADFGYNKLKDTAARAAVFNNALNSMMRFSPDVIVIACNTLTAVYPYTEFSRNEPIPVHGIIKTGVDCIEEAVRQNTDMPVIIFGTPVTIESEMYHKCLKERGIIIKKIISQQCPGLAGEIETNPVSSKTAESIRRYCLEAAEKLSGIDAVPGAALCCTHFGYAASLFQNTLSEYTGKETRIINPNVYLGKKIFDTYILTRDNISRDNHDRLVCTVHSQIPWDTAKRTVYHDIFINISPETARAVLHYTFNPELFKVF